MTSSSAPAAAAARGRSRPPPRSLRLSVKPNRPAPMARPPGTPVAEDHRGEADVAAAAGLALQVEVGGDDREEGAAEAGEAAGDDHGDVLVLVDVDAERLGGDRVLAAGAQPQAERRCATGPTRCRGTAATASEGQPGDVGDQAAEDAGEVRDEEPALGVRGRSASRDRPGTVKSAEGVDRRGLLGGAALRGPSKAKSLAR